MALIMFSRTSYNISLVQMVYYYAYRKIVATLIDVWYVEHIVGAGSLVCGKFLEENIILAGNSAKVIKKQIYWKE